MQPGQPLTTHRAYPDASLQSARSCLVWGWSLIGAGCLIALIPIIGLLNFIIGPPLILAGFILAIVAISKGRTGGGVALLLFSIIVAPLFMFVGQIVSLLGIGAAASASSATDPWASGSSPFDSGVQQPLEEVEFDPELESSAPNQ